MEKRDGASAVKNMVYTALFAAVICVVAPFSLSIGPIPVSLATFAVYLAAGTLNCKSCVLSVVLYVTLGAVGLPVFTNFEGGFHKIAGVTGGFIVGYIPCAAAAGIITGAFGKKLRSYVFGMAAGTVLLYAFGTAWFIIQTKTSFRASLLLCVLPFLPGDAVKIAAASVIAPRLQRAIRY